MLGRLLGGAAKICQLGGPNHRGRDFERVKCTLERSLVGWIGEILATSGKRVFDIFGDVFKLQQKHFAHLGINVAG